MGIKKLSKKIQNIASYLKLAFWGGGSIVCPYYFNFILCLINFLVPSSPVPPFVEWQWFSISKDISSSIIFLTIILQLYKKEPYNEWVFSSFFVLTCCLPTYGKIPWRRGWQPTPVSILDWRICMDGGIWWSAVHRFAELDITEVT